MIRTTKMIYPEPPKYFKLKDKLRGFPTFYRMKFNYGHMGNNNVYFPHTREHGITIDLIDNKWIITWSGHKDRTGKELVPISEAEWEKGRPKYCYRP
jgi:hypothetical protein